MFIVRCVCTSSTAGVVNVCVACVKLPLAGNNTARHGTAGALRVRVCGSTVVSD